LNVETKKLQGAESLDVEGVNYYRDTSGSLWFYGAVVNKGPAALGGIGLNIGLYNDRNERLARGQSLRLSKNVLQPGEKGYWLDNLSDRPETWQKTEIELGFTPSARTIQERDYTAVTASAVQTAPTSGQQGGVTVTGQITNEGGETASSIQVTVVLFDAAGTLLAVSGASVVLDPSSAVSNLPPGASAKFTQRFLPRGANPLPANPEKVEVFVRAERRQ
jgi:hypothetical protein